MHLDTERERYQKVILCIYLAMAIIFAIWTGISRSNDGVEFRETLLEVSEQGSATVYSGLVYGTPVTITRREENGTKFVNFSADGIYYADCRVEYPEGTIKTEFGTEVKRIQIIRNDEVLFAGGYDPAPEINSYMKFYNEDGTWSMDPMVSIRASNGVNPWFNFEFDMSDIIRFAGSPKTSAYGSWGWYFLAVFFSLIGALETAFPNTIFYLQHFLHVYNPEPTDFYCFCHKVGSVIYAGVIFFLYLKGVFMLG
ncbi:MAG: hypothetical protein IKM11_03415 [Oscillospiraceae bacterium]|nr:hypothetical protein [Oscillospiraceae bacterium]